MAEKGGGGGGERWKAAIVNVTEMGANLESLQKLLAKKAVFVDDDTFAKASLTADQARTIKPFSMLSCHLKQTLLHPSTFSRSCNQLTLFLTKHIYVVPSSSLNHFCTTLCFSYALELFLILHLTLSWSC
ncbi:uncharacterized protein LOC103704198 isoform X2 [Phoenix dactylifera]|uniref:Uncharacterized protein LOC103704198 isoform X2 n=1 Tax=Phoenix dactylifera TaxID=42345 RepID=A0A8B8J2N5_PHODC|nr:uncharacterized protein LOC103704198 isoform X2 [Phoenix dactylifera]